MSWMVSALGANFTEIVGYGVLAGGVLAVFGLALGGGRR